tara:strand:+ start:5039 stop:5335 length:297 start_codon:yes stop_codon:yes gene_type:complete
MDSLMQFKENQFEILKSTTDKAVVMGRLEMLKDLSIYIDNLRESYTRLLVVNGMDEEEYKERLDGSFDKKKPTGEVSITEVDLNNLSESKDLSESIEI